MSNTKPQKQIKNTRISSDIAAYLENKGLSNTAIRRINSQNVQTAARVNSNTAPVNQIQAKSTSNIRLVGQPNNKKIFKYQILFGELESMLLSMNRNDAMVQRALIKLNDIRTRIFPELRKAQEYDDTIRS